MKTDVAASGTVERTAGKALTSKLMLAAVYSFLICRCVLLGSISSFGVSFCAAMPVEYAWIAVLGSLLGYGIQGLSAATAVPMAALAVVTLVRMLLHRAGGKEPPLLPALLSGGVLFAAGLLVHLVQGFALPDLVLRGCEAVLTGGVTYLWQAAALALLADKPPAALSQTARVGVCLLPLLAVTALMSIQLSFFHFGLIAAAAGACLAARHYGALGGTLCGVFFAIAVNLYATDYLVFGAVLLVATLAAGTFHSFGKLPVAAIFLSASLFLTFIFGITLATLTQLVSILAGCALFLGVRTDWMTRLLPQALGTGDESVLRAHTERRLLFAAATVDELQQLMQSVSSRLAQIAPKDSIFALYQDTVQSVCLSCAGRKGCWQDHYAETAEGFQALTEQLKNGHRPGSETLEETTLSDCMQKETLTDTISSRYQTLLRREAQKRQSDQLCSLAAEQFGGISDMLRGLGDELCHGAEPDNRAAVLVRDLFTALAAPPQSCFANLNEFDRMELDIYCSAAVQFDEESLREEFSRALRRPFAAPIVSQAQNNIRLSFFEEAAFSAELCCRQAAARDADNVCGDTCTHFSDFRGSLYLILSDGMGTGREAAVDSSLTCSMITKLIRAGFGMDAVLKFVNSTLQANHLEETLSTIDLAKLDLYTGRVEFYKAGSASSFVSLDGIVAEVASHSLPVGILQGIRFDRKVVLLNDGDLLVLLSDGVLTPDHEAVKRYLEDHQEEPLCTLADGLIDAAKAAAPDGRYDDLSVLAARLHKNR